MSRLTNGFGDGYLAYYCLKNASFLRESCKIFQKKGSVPVFMNGSPQVEGEFVCD
jgi:hypothetical protein